MTSFRYRSEALGAEQTAQVYVPSGKAPEEGWPVLYLLHGRDGNPTDWDRLGNVRGTLDRLIDGKRIRPMLVVMPPGANSWYVDSADVGGPGNYATAIGRDLPDAIEDAFPVNADRMGRAIAGVSMGGYGALRLALADPERYGAVAAISPAIWQNIPASPPDLGAGAEHPVEQPYFMRQDPYTVTVGVDLPPPGVHFGRAFGSPFDPARFNAANVFTLLQQCVSARKLTPPVYLTVGDDDSHLLWRGSIALFETMEMNKRKVEFRVTDGDHDWGLWKQDLADVLAFVDRSLSKVAQR